MSISKGEGKTGDTTPDGLTSAEQRVTVAAPGLVAMLLLMQPRMQLCLHYRSMLLASTSRGSTGVSAQYLSAQQGHPYSQVG